MVTRLSGGLTPADGADPRTFPAIWNPVADTIEGLEAKNVPSFGTATPSVGDSLVFDGSDWVNGPRSGNAVINGDFGVWQRGTAFSSNGYSADRWNVQGSGGTLDVNRGSFTPADLAVIGYGDAEYYFDFELTVADDNANFSTPIEDVRTFAGQEVTLSFWAKSVSNVDILIQLRQDFGPGGSSDAVTTLVNTQSIASSWTRYSFTATLPSISGKTIVDGSYLNVFFVNPANETWDMQVWGVQLEAGSVATPFKLAGGGSKAAELALCQRYFVEFGGSNLSNYGTGFLIDADVFVTILPYPVEMRTTPSASVTDATKLEVLPKSFSPDVSAISFDTRDNKTLYVEATLVANATEGEGGYLRNRSGETASIYADAEL